MAVFFSSETNTAQATYNPTFSMKFCNGLPAFFPSPFGDADLNGTPACADPAAIALDTAYDITTQYNVPAGSSNFGSSVFTMIDNTFHVSTDAAVDDGAKVGGLSSKVTLGLLNGACSTLLTVQFVLYDSTTTLGATNPLAEGTANRNRPLVTDYEAGTATGTITTSDKSFVDGMAIENGKVDVNLDGLFTDTVAGVFRTKNVKDGWVDLDGDGTTQEAVDDTGTIVQAGKTTITITSGGVDGVGDEIGNKDSPFVSNKIGFYDILFDPDLDYPGGTNGVLPAVAPRARYTGMARVPIVTGDWQLLTFFQFDAGSLKAFNSTVNNGPHSFGRVFRDVKGAGDADAVTSLSILNDPTATRISPSPIVDFCAPLEVTTMLKGTASSAQVRGKTPLSGSTHMIMSWSYGQRDADNDLVENAYDSCPFTANTDDGHVDLQNPPNDHDGKDHDGDGINDACDAGIGFPSTGGGSQTDVDGDGFANRQDNCPQTPNGGVNQRDQENQVTYLSSAPDGGTKTDQVGDACDGAIQTGCVVTPPGTANSNTIDDDGDGTVNDGCPGGGPATIGDPESSSKGDNPTGAGNVNTAYPGSGGYNQKIIFVPKCINNTDVDGDDDGYCTAQDLNDADPAIRGYSVNKGPDQDGNSAAQTDKYGAAEEFYLGTDYYVHCGGTGWPSDLVSSNKVDIDDVLALKPVFGALVTTNLGARNDLVPSKKIDIDDVLSMKPVFGATCTPP